MKINITQAIVNAKLSIIETVLLKTENGAKKSV